MLSLASASAAQNKPAVGHSIDTQTPAAAARSPTRHPRPPAVRQPAKYAETESDASVQAERRLEFQQRRIRLQQKKRHVQVSILAVSVSTEKNFVYLNTAFLGTTSSKNCRHKKII
jgi:hypothetical protein